MDVVDASPIVTRCRMVSVTDMAQTLARNLAEEQKTGVNIELGIFFKRLLSLVRWRWDAWPDPEYRTRENLGERLVYFVLKAKTVSSLKRLHGA
jgi:hypothetical protein